MTGLYRANHRQIVRFRLSGCNDEGRGTGHSSDIAGVDRLDTTSVPRVSSVIAVANTSDYASSRIGQHLAEAMRGGELWAAVMIEEIRRA